MKTRRNKVVDLFFVGILCGIATTAFAVWINKKINNIDEKWEAELVRRGFGEITVNDDNEKVFRFIKIPTEIKNNE